MAHRTLVSGTAYALAGGRILLSGTQYAQKAGCARMAGTAQKLVFARIAAVRITREYTGNATSYCRVIYNGTTYNDPAEFTVNAGESVEFFVMSIGAMAASACIKLNDVVVQQGPGAYTMEVDTDLRVQFNRYGTGTKLYYEIAITR